VKEGIGEKVALACREVAGRRRPKKNSKKKQEQKKSIERVKK